MSTYTDLHNKVKETLNVDYHNRITPQKVKFLNEENEYWGTLKGNISAEDIYINGGVIQNIDLKDVKLLGEVVTESGIDLNKVGQNIAQISIDTENVAVDLKNVTVDLKNFKENTDKAFGELSSAIDNIVVDANTELSVLSDRIDEVKSALSSEIISAKSALSSEIIDETNNRIYEQEKLQNQLTEVDRASIERDIELNDDLAEHIIENNKQFEAASKEMKTTVSHDKHYEINDQGTTDVYPYKAKDYCINVFRANVPDAHVTYTDNNNKIVDIGVITFDTSATFLPFTFKTFAKVDSPITSAYVDGVSYKFSESQTYVDAGINNYVIRLDNPVGNTDIAKAKLKLVPQLPDYHEIYLSGTNEVIGKVTNNDQPTPETNISGGELYIDTTNSDLVTFNKFRKCQFDTENNVIQKEADRITYELNNILKFEKNVTEDKFISLIDTVNEAHENFGRIHEFKDGISGVIYDEDGSVKELNIDLFIDGGYDVKLNKENDFYKVITSDNTTETVLSGRFSDNTHVDLDVVLKKELYGYHFVGIDESGAEVDCGLVIPQVYNKKLVDNPDYMTVDVDITKIMWIKTFCKKITLNKVVSDEVYWTHQETDETTDNSLYVKFDGYNLIVKTTSKDGVQIISQEYKIKRESPVIVNEDYNTVKYSSGVVDLTNISEVIYIPEATYYGVIAPGESADQYTEYILDVDTESVNIVKIEFPDKTFEDVSREFFITIKLDSMIDKSVKAKFIYSDGKDVTFYNNKKTELYLQASPNEKSWTTYMVNEVRQNRFLITDLNDYEDHQILAKLLEEVENLHKTDADLSSQILSNDADISDLSSKQIEISGKVDNKVYLDKNRLETISVFNVDQATYHEKKENNAILSNELYVVNFDGKDLDLYNKQIKNVVAPSVDTDATNKKYVDDNDASVLLSAKTYSDQLSLSLSSTISSDYTTKVEVNKLSSEITSDINLIQNAISGENAICSQLSDVRYHYARTFTEEHYTSGPDSDFDVLNIVNSQDTTNKFKLIYLSGTLVLQNISVDTSSESSSGKKPLIDVLKGQ